MVLVSGKTKSWCREPVQRMQRSEAPVNAVCRKDAESSVLASNDGSTCVYNWITKCVEAELTGARPRYAHQELTVVL